MSYTIGFAGKGGTGKSTIAAIVTRYIAEVKKVPVLAVDADPSSTLGPLLGLEAGETIVGIIDDISANIDKLPSGVTKERLVESRVHQSLGEGEGCDLLAMGRPEGPGCYCYPNSLLRVILGRVSRGYKFIVIDNEAGMEHISRRTDRRIDYFFLISDPTVYGLRSARRISELANELKIAMGKNHLIVNRVKKVGPELEAEVKAVGAERVDYLEESEDILDSSVSGRPITELPDDSKAIKSIYKICEEAKWA